MDFVSDSDVDVQKMWSSFSDSVLTPEDDMRPNGIIENPVTLVPFILRAEAPPEKLSNAFQSPPRPPDGSRHPSGTSRSAAYALYNAPDT